MTNSVVVFDFDKTLTDKDTLFGFYRTVAGNDRLFYPKRIILLAAGVLYKAGLINNSTLKRVGISLFLKGRNHEELEVSARKYAEQIKLNDIYRTHYVNTDGEKWVVSASPEIYLKYLFPGEYVAGTRFTYSSDQVKGLDINMFGPEKKCFFLKMGITNITELYTDSMTDKPLMDIAESVFIINQGKINQLK